MKKYIFVLALFLFTINSFVAQTYQLLGNPVVTTGWTLTNNAIVSTDFIQLTPDNTSQVGAIKLNDPINLKYCNKWKVEFDMRIDGNGTTAYGRGDGLSFWYLANPPANFVGGGGIGIPNGGVGFMAAFDIFNNATEGQMSKVHLLYGVSTGNIEYNTTAGSAYHTANLQATTPFVGTNYRHVEVSSQTDTVNPLIWIITVKIDGLLILTQPLTPTGAAATMTTGYFGFSAATGGASARHSIKNVKVYVDKVPLLQSTLVPASICQDAISGVGTVDLTSFNSQLTSTPANYNFTYFVQGNPTPIATPTAFTFAANTVITVYISDPNSTYCDNPDGKINLTLNTVQHVNGSLKSCNINGVGIFNLTSVVLSSAPGVTYKYYPTQANLVAGTAEILTPTAYVSTAPKQIFVKVTSNGCSAISTIDLDYFPNPVVNDATISACFIQDNLTYGIFDLTSANVTTVTPVVKNYYATLVNAQNGVAEITAPTTYLANNGFVYVKVTNANGCSSYAKITLAVIPPKPSATLVNQVICPDTKATLNAGPGYTSYLWNTGETSASITAPVGDYWVLLTSNGCVYKQNVKVSYYPSPSITSVDVKNNTATVYASGGNPPYQYSNNNISWQTSNVFINLPRGAMTFYVKDNNNCTPTSTVTTILNIVNAITPNHDGFNDYLDYSELAYKDNLELVIYDRYGKLIQKADKSNGYRWDGTFFGRNINTGTYWYVFSWNEPDANKTKVVFSGWILVKNRD